MASPFLGPFVSYKSAPAPIPAELVLPPSYARKRTRPRRHWLLRIAGAPFLFILWLLVSEKRQGQKHPSDLFI